MIILPERALQFGYLEPVGEIAKSTSPKGPKDSAQGFNHTGETPMLPWARRRAGPRELEAVFATAAAGGRAKSSIGVPPVFSGMRLQIQGTVRLGRFPGLNP